LHGRIFMSHEVFKRHKNLITRYKEHACFFLLKELHKGKFNLHYGYCIVFLTILRSHIPYAKGCGYNM
jgi:hypothetical protein